MTTTPIPLSKEAVYHTLEPHLDLMGRADRERIKSLLGVMQQDGRMQLSDVLNVLYPQTSNDDYTAALAAFRQFRLRLKIFTQNDMGINFVLKSDTQTRTKPHQRWCWFEGDDRSIEEIALFSANETEMVNRIETIEQMALAIKLDEALPAVSYSSTTNVFRSEDDKAVIESNRHYDVMGLLEVWVRDRQQPYCALLGEYGMGKTITCMRFTQWLLKERKLDATLPLPIYLDLRNLSNKTKSHEMDLSSIIHSILRNGVYRNQTDTPLEAKEVIRLVQEEGALVIFDGLDEVLVHLSAVAGQQFTHKLLSILVFNDRWQKKPLAGQLLMTCRTHYFRTMRDQKTLFTDEERYAIMADDYRVLMLLPFNTLQIAKYFRHAVPHIDTEVLLELIRSVHNLSELAERPYTLSLIPSLIPQIEYWERNGIRVTGVTLYRHIVLSWLERDAGKHKLTMDHKQQLMEHFAAELWRSGKRCWNIADVENWFVQFLHARPSMAAHYVLGRDENALYLILETMKEDLRTATFLVRIGESDFCFAHTSLQEFFLATYLYRALLEQHFEDWAMPIVSKETLGFLGQLISEEGRPEVLTALCVLRDTYRPQISEMAFAYMIFAQAHGYATPELSGFHLDGAHLKEWTILGHSAEQLLDLRKVSFRGANLNQANLNYLNLDEADFTEAQLNSTEFMYNHLQNTLFKNADLRGSLLRNAFCKNADFSGAQVEGTTWVSCDLEGVHGLDPHHSSIFYSQCEPSAIYALRDSDKLPSIHDCVVFSPDGRSLISASWDNTLRLWDIDSGQCFRVFSGHTGWIRACAVSPTGQHIVSASEDKTLRLWDINTGECVRVFTGHTMMARGCAFSPDGKMILSASWDRTLRLWDIETGECIRIMSKHSQGVNHCAYAPNGQHVASALEDGSLLIWDPTTGNSVRSLLGHQGIVRACAYSPDSHYLVSGAVDNTLRVWNVLTGECLHELKGHQSRIRSCAFSPDGLSIVSASEDKTLRIWSMVTGSCLSVFRGHKDKVRACAYSPDGKMIASGGNEQVIQLWQAQTGELIKTLGQV